MLGSAVGPGIGAGFQFGDIWLLARDGDANAGDWLRFALQNTPFINLWYVRPALDFLFINSLQEAARPGFLQRQERRRRKEMGQTRLWDAQGGF